MYVTQTWVVAYDIEDDRRRNKLFKLLRGFGDPRQKSLFVCHLTPARQVRLKALLAQQQLDEGDKVDMFLVKRAEGRQPFPAAEALWVVGDNDADVVP